MRASTAFLVMVPMLLVTLLFVATQGRRVGVADPARGAQGLYWDEGLEAFVRQRVAGTYVDALSREESERAFWRAMEAYVRFDPYCDVIPPSEYRQWKEGTAGQYGGLGIRVDPQPEGLRVIGTLPQGPAAKAGLVPGDLLLSADGRTLGGIDLRVDSAARLLKGAPGSAVRLEVRSAAGTARELMVVRQIVRPPAVYARRVGPRNGVGVVRVTEFVESTPAEFDAALDPLLADPKLEGLVLDLRDNAGGVLAAAVHVADRFLTQGLIVRMSGRAPGTSRDYAARPCTEPADVKATLPIAVLVNGYSASASEVVAGALQDHRRALLVGERTYGKFLVQQIIEAPRGDCAVQLVTSRYYTPSGRSYQRRVADGPPRRSAGEGTEVEPALDAEGEPAGLLPDVVQALARDERTRLLELWDNEEDERWGAVPRHPEVAAGWVDPQLARALEVLEGELLARRIRPAGGSER
jgi:carboxyl-terminal processing protease